MQFGIGLLGKNYDPEVNLQLTLDDTRSAHRNFEKRAGRYAAKLAADTVLAEPPTQPELDDESLVRHFAGCARPVHFSEVAMVRDAFVRDFPTTPTPPTTAPREDPS